MNFSDLTPFGLQAQHESIPIDLKIPIFSPLLASFQQNWHQNVQN